MDFDLLSPLVLFYIFLGVGCRLFFFDVFFISICI